MVVTKQIFSGQDDDHSNKGQTMKHQAPGGSETQTDIVPSSSYGALKLELLLYALQSPINIGMILRTAEAYQFQVSILDLHGVIANPEKLSTLMDFACGAWSRRPLRRLNDPLELDVLRSGRRLVATSSEDDSSPLSTYRFLPGDLIVLGNEYDGLPEKVVSSADEILYVPMAAVSLPKEKSRSPIDPTRTAPIARDGQPNLNVAMTAGIMCYAAYAEWLAQHGAEGAS